MEVSPDKWVYDKELLDIDLEELENDWFINTSCCKNIWITY
jgi:hypothetical protein